MPASKHENRMGMERGKRTSKRELSSRCRPGSLAIVSLHSWNRKHAQNRDYTCETLESQ
jgi:hypothetical protein